MKDVTVAGRYARGFFLFTERRGETAQALADLKALLDVIGPHTQAGRFLASPVVMLEEKRRVLEKSFGSRVPRAVLVFLDLLLRKKRLDELPVVVSEFEALVEKLQGIQRAHVVSAVPLETPEVERLHRALERYTNSRVKLDSEVDPRLIAGALVRIGDHLIDRSARTLLQVLEERLQHVNV